MIADPRRAWKSCYSSRITDGAAVSESAVVFKISVEDKNNISSDFLNVMDSREKASKPDNDVVGKPVKAPLMQLNDTKAGMTGLDKEKINKIIEEASKHTPFYQRQLERQQKLDSQIQQMVQRMSKLTREQIRCATAEMDNRSRSLEPRKRDLSRILVHLDMDMFFAAVEIRDDPSLAEKPMAVGTNSMLSTSNYVARKYGVRAGMAGFIGKKLCPELVIIAPNFAKYTTASKRVMGIIEEYDANYSSSSLDEASFDLTPYVKDKYQETSNSLDAKDNILPEGVWKMAFEVVNEIRARIHLETNLTASAGIAHNTMFAKLCSDLNKPNGQFMLTATSIEAVEAFLHDQPCRKIPGIGPVQEQYLKGIGIEKCRDLYEKRGLVFLLFTPASVEFYLRVSLGISSSYVSKDDDTSIRKSLGSETTFKATNDMKFLEQVLRDLSNEVSEELKKKSLIGRKITLVIKWASFVSIDRGRSLSFYTNDVDVIFEQTKSRLVEEIKIKEDHSPGGDATKIRLLGVRVSTLITGQGSPEKANYESGPSVAKKSKKQSTLLSFVEKSPSKKSPVDQDHHSSDSNHGNDSNEYVCIDCFKDFANEKQLERHQSKGCNSMHEDPESPKSSSFKTPAHLFPCPACNLQCESLVNLNIHLDDCVS